MFAVKLPEGSLNLPTKPLFIPCQATNHQQSSDSGSDRFFQDDTMCWFVESNSLHGHILMLQHPIKTLLRRSLRKTISYWWSTHFISHIEFRMVGWVESSIDKHQLPQFEHRKMMSNAAVSCLSWPQLVRYIYDKPLHLIVFSNR
jgi:hypothetical protein